MLKQLKSAARNRDRNPNRNPSEYKRGIPFFI